DGSTHDSPLHMYHDAQAEARRLHHADSAGSLAGRLDEDELGPLSGEADLDVAGGQLRVELDGRLREQVEQLQPQVRAERLTEPPGHLCRPLVPELGEALQVFLEPFQHDRQIHRDITMTSVSASVKCRLRI